MMTDVRKLSAQCRHIVRPSAWPLTFEQIERMKHVCVWLCIQAAVSCCNNSFFCYPRMETLYAPSCMMFTGVRQGGQGGWTVGNILGISLFPENFQPKMQNFGWKKQFWENLWAKLKFWAPIILSACNLQLSLSVKKLQLHVYFSNPRRRCWCLP